MTDQKFYKLTKIGGPDEISRNVALFCHKSAELSERISLIENFFATGRRKGAFILMFC